MNARTLSIAATALLAIAPVLVAQPKLIAAQLARRDATGIYSDWLHLMVGTYYDHRTAYRFSVNPLGVKKDVLEYNDNNEDVNWDAVWDVATRVDSLGWIAEYRVPFSQLRARRIYAFDVYGRDVGTVTHTASGYTIDPDGAGAAPSFAIGDPNFNIRSLHGDAVLRWEYRPGSTLFFVWQQQRDGFEPIGDLSFARDAGAIFRAQPTDVFLVKLAYWMGR